MVAIQKLLFVVAAISAANALPHWSGWTASTDAPSVEPTATDSVAATTDAASASATALVTSAASSAAVVSGSVAASGASAVSASVSASATVAVSASASASAALSGSASVSAASISGSQTSTPTAGSHVNVTNTNQGAVIGPINTPVESPAILNGILVGGVAVATLIIAGCVALSSRSKARATAEH